MLDSAANIVDVKSSNCVIIDKSTMMSNDLDSHCQMNLLLKEYILSGDSKEAERCLQDLEVPHFHHEFVYEVDIKSVNTVTWVSNCI